MIGTPANKEILRDAGILGPEGDNGRARRPDPGAARADCAAGEAALAEARRLLDQPSASGTTGVGRRVAHHSRRRPAAARRQSGADLGPGTTSPSPRRARHCELGLNVMIFSDNVPIEDEAALKREARERGLLVMGPDCGTAIIGGVPLGFRQRRPARRHRHHRRLGHRHPGGVVPDRARRAAASAMRSAPAGATSRPRSARSRP